jgi:hypothetical protein
MRFEQQRSLLLYLQKWHGTIAAELIRWFLVLLAFFRLAWVSVISRSGSVPNSKRLHPRTTAMVMLQGLLKLNTRHF